MQSKCSLRSRTLEESASEEGPDAHHESVVWRAAGDAISPRLNERIEVAAVQPKRALLINPFYPKDPHASFGKHVLTPSLALTSVAGATPSDWHVSYWDENLLQGPPPWAPFPQVVGITVHLTFAERAYELAKWYRSGGRSWC